MGAPLKFNGLDTFFFGVFSRSISSFSDVRSWKSPITSRSIEHRAITFSICSLLISGEIDLVLRRLLWSFPIVVEGGLASKWGRWWKIFGEEKEEKVKEGRVGV